MIDNSETTKSPAPSRHILAIVGGAILGIIVTCGFLLVIGAILTREAVPLLTPADFNAAVERWEKNGPKAYDCDIEIFGNRPGTVQIEVRAGVVSRMTRDGEAPRERRTWDVWTVEGMFDTIDRELQIAADPQSALGGTARPILSARFHLQLGYPEVFRRSVPGAQQEMAWKITRFRSLDQASP